MSAYDSSTTRLRPAGNPGQAQCHLDHVPYIKYMDTPIDRAVDIYTLHAEEPHMISSHILIDQSVP